MNTSRSIMLLALNLFATSSVLAARLDKFEETYLGTAEAQEQKGQGVELGVLATLNIPRGAYVESLILVSSSAQGHGRVDVLINNQVVGTIMARETIRAEQISIRAVVGRGLQTLRLKTYGNVQLAHYAVTINEELSLDEGRHKPGHGGGVGPGRPGYPDHYDQIVSMAEFRSLINELKNTSFDSGKEQVVISYMNFWRGQKVTMDQLAEIVKTMSFDSNKVNVIRIVRPLLLVDVSKMSLILNNLSFDSSKAEARKILM